MTSESLHLALSDVEKALIRSASPVITRRAAAVERTTREFGELLTDSVFTGDVRLLFEQCRKQARAQGVPLRLLLAPTGPNLSRIPWEFAVDPAARDAYLALRVPMVRSPQLMESVEPYPLSPPLRVLGVMARPSDRPTLDSDREREEITRALQGMSTGVSVEWLAGDRWSDVAAAVRDRRPHVLHFVGHGGFDEERDSGYIELTAEDGASLHVSGTDLGTLVREIPQLRLIVLNACESATCGAEGVFTSTAARIIHEGVPAVVAMQFEITDPAALTFASSFYTGIAQGLPVDRSMTLARESVKMTLSGTLEWATPVLFLASKDPRLFKLPEAPPQDVDPQDPSPGPMPTPPSSTSWPDATTGPSQVQDVPNTVRAKVTDFLRKRTTRPSDHPWQDRNHGPTFTRPPESGPSSAPTFAPPRPSGEPSAAPNSGPAPGELRRTKSLSPLGACYHVSLGPRNLLAMARTDGSVRVASSATGDLVADCTFRPGNRAFQVAWSPWPRNVASLHEDGSTVVWDVATEVPVRVLPGRPRQMQTLAFSPDGRWLAVAGNGRLHVYDSNGSRVRDLPLDPLAERTSATNVGALSFSPDGRHLLVGTGEGLLRQLDVYGRLIRTWPHPQPVAGLAATGSRVATGGPDGRICLWGWDGQLLLRIRRAASVRRLALSHDNTLLAAASDDGSLSLWNSSGQCTAQGWAYGPPAGIGVLSGGTGLMTCTVEGVVEQWPLTPEVPAPPGGLQT
ncbi:CHAT domain-containing protein [Streptomyces sp. BH106]|uniref:CHAT domain-containing protein n=1 Tax=Streptomyces sp. BH106 TaxID=3410409 RepID=UPI003CEC0D24